MTERPNFFLATLTERVNFCDKLAGFRFRTEQPMPDFTPGQYATLGMEIDGRFVQRPYSLVSSPHEEFAEFYVELVPNGMLTPRLWALKPGDSVYMKKSIIGKFVLQDQLGMRRHIMVSTVTGGATTISIVRAQIAAIESGKLAVEDAHRILFLHSASCSWELGTYKEEMSVLAAKHEWLAYVPAVSRPWEDPQWAGETGRAEELLRKYADSLGYDHTNSIGYVCGHPQMIENAKGILARMRFPKEHIREEKFYGVKSSEARAGARVQKPQAASMNEV